MKNENGYNQLNNLKQHKPFNLYYKGEYFSNYKYDDELKRYQSDYGYLTLEAVYQILNDNQETRKIEWI